MRHAMTIRPLTAVAWILLATPIAAGEPAARSAHREALAPWQGVVGTWRGTGQPQRGSARGAWTESCQWSWRFDKHEAALVFDSPEGKYFASGSLTVGERPGTFELAARSSAGEPVRYAGTKDEAGQLVLTAEKPTEGQPQRISLRLVAGGERLVILFERKLGDRYARLAELGMTRQGGMFAVGPGFVECVVTGGQGTIAVAHKGQTYYVCCTGCRDLFNDDPEGALAEYRARKEKERAKP
jgi:YHS domain-containing protein